MLTREEEHRQALDVLQNLSQLPGAPTDTIAKLVRHLHLSHQTPARYLLNQLETQQIEVRELLSQDPLQHRRWFAQLDQGEKARWLHSLNAICTWNQLQELLGVTAARLKWMCRHLAK